MSTALRMPTIPTGQIKTFGEFGPKYEVSHALRQLADGDWMVEINLIETGESTEYRLSRISEDLAGR
jgi:hypothetical protein